MKLSVIENHTKRSVEGSEARAVLRRVLKGIGEGILLPEPPFTGVVRRRALDRLREGGSIWEHADEHGHPRGLIVSMPPKVLGILKRDADGNEVFEAAAGLSPEEAKEVEDMMKAGQADDVQTDKP